MTILLHTLGQRSEQFQTAMLHIDEIHEIIFSFAQLIESHLCGFLKLALLRLAYTGRFHEHHLPYAIDRQFQQTFAVITYGSVVDLFGQPGSDESMSLHHYDDRMYAQLFQTTCHQQGQV